MHAASWLRSWGRNLEGKSGGPFLLIRRHFGRSRCVRETRGLIHGQSHITAADPSRTTILGNFHMNYNEEPAECREFPWHARLLTTGHTEIECDPKVWSAVKTLILRRLQNSLATATDPGEPDLRASGTGGGASQQR